MDRKTAIKYFYKRMELGDIENDTQQLAYETAIDFMEKYEELKHFLEMEIALAEERMKLKHNPTFNGVEVGHENQIELNKAHIRYCEYAIKALCNEEG